MLIAALRERMVDLAATDADGAFPYLVTPERVRWIRERLDAAGSRPILAVTLPAVLDAAGSPRRGACLPHAVSAHSDLPGELGSCRALPRPIGSSPGATASSMPWSRSATGS